MRTETLGRLHCTISDPEGGAPPQRLVILSHGFGAPGTDLVPLAQELIYHDASLETGTQWIFPSAPMSLDSHGIPGGRAWWLIDLENRIQAIERGHLDIFRNDFPDGMEEASDQLLSVVEAALDQTSLDPSRLVLGGFSQGSMVSTDVALRMKEPPSALAILSGTLLCEDRWKSFADGQSKFPILQTHGRMDPILPFQCAEWLREMLQSAGFKVDLRDFLGAHQIPPTAMEGLGDLIRNITIE